MTSHIEFLPIEIFDLILGYIDEAAFYPSLAALLQGCHRLHERLEPLLYGRNRDAVTRALRWGCRAGSLPVVRLAVVRYGAPVNVSVAQQGWKEATAVPTLYLAAKHQQTETFHMLLGLGARLNDPDDWAPEMAADRPAAKVRLDQYSSLIRRFCVPATMAAHSDFIAEFVRAGMLDQMRSDPRCPPELYDPLARLVRAGAPVDLVRLLLDRGADPNGRGEGPEGALSPLSAAVLAGSAPVFALLLERGADINGRKLGRRGQEGDEKGKDPETAATTRTGMAVSEWPPFRVFFIPSFAAAYAMARRHPRARSMMQLCLEAGADINEGVLVRRRMWRGIPMSGGWLENTVLTVLSAYLESIESWDNNEGRKNPSGGGRKQESPEDSHDDVVDDTDLAAHLAFLLDRGATVDDTSHWSVAATRRPSFVIVLNRWNGAAISQQPACAAVVAQLLAHGAVHPGGTTRVLREFVDPDREYHKPSTPRQAWRAWPHLHAREEAERRATAAGLAVLARLLAAATATDDECLRHLVGFVRDWGGGGLRRKSVHIWPRHRVDHDARFVRIAIWGIAQALVDVCVERGVRFKYCGPPPVYAEVVGVLQESDHTCRRGGPVCDEFHEQVRKLRLPVNFPDVNDGHLGTAAKLLRLLVDEEVDGYTVLFNSWGMSRACSCTEYFLLALEHALPRETTE